jgi:hypothetical protein
VAGTVILSLIVAVLVVGSLLLMRHSRRIRSQRPETPT